MIRAAKKIYARKMNIITIITHFLKNYSNLNAMHCKKLWFQLLVCDVSNPKYGILGHWQSEVSILEMENFHTNLAFIRKTFNSKANISMKPQNTDFDFSGLQICI